MTLNFDPVTLTFNLWPWTFVVCRLCRSQTLYKIWAKSDNPQRSYCRLNIWPYDLEHVSRVSQFSGMVCTKFKLSQAICLWNVTIFFTLIRHVTLWPWPLTPWPWTFVIVRASWVQTLCKIWAKSNNPLQSYWRFSYLFSRGIVRNSTPQRGWTKLYQIGREQSSIIDVPTPKFW